MPCCRGRPVTPPARRRASARNRQTRAAHLRPARPHPRCIVKHLHLVIRGRVQGVGYRASMADMADRHGVTGWVRNRHDGSVEAQLHGPADGCEALLAWARLGPRAARVEQVEVSALPADTPVPGRFELHPTA